MKARFTVTGIMPCEVAIRAVANAPIAGSDNQARRTGWDQGRRGGSAQLESALFEHGSNNGEFDSMYDDFRSRED